MYLQNIILNGKMHKTASNTHNRKNSHYSKISFFEEHIAENVCRQEVRNAVVYITRE